MEDNQFSILFGEVAGLIGSGSVEEAVNRSGELLAMVDAEWTRRFNSGDRSDASLERLAAAAFLHVNALEAAGEAASALSTAVVALYVTVIDRSECQAVDRGRLMLWHKALTVFDALACAMDADDFTRPHVEAIGRYMASMTYALYKRLAPSGWQPLGEVYATLRPLVDAGVVSWPSVDVNGVAVDPCDAAPLMADLAGRLRALGLLEV